MAMLSRFHQIVLAGLALAWCFAGNAAAGELVATHAGLMCRSQAALVRLTDDSGADRTLGHHSPADDILKSQGACIDIAPGLRVTAIEEKVGISKISCAIGNQPESFFVANMDFAPAPANAPAEATAAPAATGATAVPAATDAAAPSAATDATAASTALADGGQPPPLSGADIALLAGAASVPAAPAPPDITVTGLRLGMTEDMAHAVLGHDWHFTAEHSLGDAEDEHIAVSGPDPNNQYRLGFIANGLWFVNHRMVFPAGRQPTRDRIINLLAQKYGPPISEDRSDPNGYRASWQFDAKGSPITTPIDPCLNASAPFAGHTAKAKAAPDYPDRLTNDCPVMVSALALPDPQAAGRVARLQIILSEPQTIFQHKHSAEQALAAQKLSETALASREPAASRITPAGQ